MNINIPDPIVFLDDTPPKQNLTPEIMIRKFIIHKIRAGKVAEAQDLPISKNLHHLALLLCGTNPFQDLLFFSHTQIDLYT